MPLDDEGDDDVGEGPGPLLPPEDRLWRHPSELAAPAHPPHTHARPWGLVLAAGLTGAVLTAGLITVIEGIGEHVVERQVVERVAVQPAVSTPGGASGVVAIAERLRPAIVRIDVAGGGEEGSGSGVIFRDDGTLLTNAHVVKDADAIDIVLADGRHMPGEVLGTDDLTDIAVVRIDKGGDDTVFEPAMLGSAADLRVGELAVAIGSPLGLLGGPSVTTGVISALGRRVDKPDGEPLHDLIQTDAPIAPGSSGGALVDGSGAVIGVTTVIALGADGSQFGFAVPIDVARDVAEDIIVKGKAMHVWLGVEGRDLTADVADDLGVPGAAVLRRVLDDGPADAAGLRAGDVIVALDGREVTTMSGLVIALRGRDPGDDVEITYLRSGERITTTLRLAERPDDVPG
jgi:S1-C subfamily serine protease